jgi:dTDP-4-dehydrorhamnose 3,5-epimerase
MKNEIEIIDGKIFADDRGYVSFVNNFNFENVKRFYMVENHKKDFIRAWHGHKIEAKYVYVTNGSILIGLVNLETNKIEKKIVLSSKTPSILYIPPGYANGFKTLEENTKIIFFSTTTIEEAKTDDYRYPYDTWNIWNEEYR